MGFIGGIITFIFLYLTIVNTFGFEGYRNQNIELFMLMVYGMIIVLSILVILSVKSLIKEK